MFEFLFGALVGAGLTYLKMRFGVALGVKLKRVENDLEKKLKD